MCGIIGYVGTKEPKGILLDALKRLEYRGYDSAGIAVFQDGHVEVFRCSGKLENLERELTHKRFNGHTGIGHTRWATHGSPTEMNAHPHRVGQFTLVHNGIIENFVELRAEAQAAGRTIQSETDTEIIAHILDMEYQKSGSVISAVMNTLPQLRGSYALSIIHDSAPEQVIGVRNGAPLIAGVGEGENFLASDVQAVLHRTRNVIYLDDAQVAILTPTSIKLTSFEGLEKVPQVRRLDWSPDQTDRGGYRHFMLKEIHEQPSTIANTLQPALRFVENHPTIKISSLTTEQLKAVQSVRILACGTSRHAGLMAKYYFEQFCKVPTEVEFASEYRYYSTPATASVLTILISQSGETADTLACVKGLKEQGATTIAMCNVRESTLARECAATVYTQAGPEVGVAATKTFTAQITALMALAIEMGAAKGILDEPAVAELSHYLAAVPAQMDRVFQMESLIENLAVRYESTPLFFIIGRGLLYPLSLETALKLQEIAYVHAEGFPAGELKHGPIALLDRKTIVLAFCPKYVHYKSPALRALDELNETIYEKTVSNIQEVKARGAQLFIVGDESDESLKSMASDYLGLPPTSWATSPLLYSLVLQMLAYYVALQKGTDIDKPRNLAKSVTVE